jgi:hypothetical protein
MTVSLYISNQLIDCIPVDLSKCRTFEYRKEKVEGVIKWLLYYWRQSIAIKDNWRIEIAVESKMNKQLNQLL